MQKQGTQYLEKALIFFITWIISWLLWAFFLDGIYAFIAGCITAVTFSIINQLR
jgi:hypothetical protein